MSLSEWLSFIECVPLGQKKVLTTVYSIFGFEPFHKFYLSKSKLLKDFAFEFLVSDALGPHPGKLVHERTVLRRVQKFIKWTVNSTIAPLKRTWLLNRFQKIFFHTDLSLQPTRISLDCWVRGMLERNNQRLLTWYFLLCVVLSITWLDIKSTQNV